MGLGLYDHYLRLLIAFPLVVILTYFCLRFFLPRFAPSLGMGRRIQVVERAALNNRTFLYIIKVGKDYLLLASTGGGVTLLKDLGTSLDNVFLSPINKKKENIEEDSGKLSRNLEIEEKNG